MKALNTTATLLSFKIKGLHERIDLIDYFVLGKIVNVYANRLYHLRDLVVRGIEKYGTKQLDGK